MITSIRRYLLEGALQTALQKHAEAIGDRAKHTELHKHHAAERASIDPMEDHWGYAAARDTELAHEAKQIEEDHMVQKQRRRIEELKRQLAPLPKAPGKRPWLLFLRQRIVAV